MTVLVSVCLNNGRLVVMGALILATCGDVIYAMGVLGSTVLT